VFTAKPNDFFQAAPEETAEMLSSTLSIYAA
jgi:hypothetical protein